jgi:DNA primase
MLVVDNKIIETPIKTIVNLLRQQLFLMHIDKLDRIEYKQNNIRCICPIHSGGHERTPSCSILLESKGDIAPGTVHCFGCGYRASLVKFISDCLNISYRKAKEWLLGAVEYSIVESNRDISDIALEGQFSASNNNWSEVTLDELRKYDYVHEYMFKRKLTDDIIDKFEVGYDPILDAITFPVYVDGICRLVCKRRVKFKRFEMPPINPKPIYGLDYLTDNEVIVCESVINALTCWSYGKQAVALFGTGSDWQIEQLNKIPQRHIVLALDGDEAGRKGTTRLIKGLTNKIVTVLKIPNGKDINDLTKEEFDNLEESF